MVVHCTPGINALNYLLPFLPLAPVQCIGFGIHGTTGIEGIDYCVSSRLFERGPETAEDYTEELVLFDSSTLWQQRPVPRSRHVRHRLWPIVIELFLRVVWEHEFLHHDGLERRDRNAHDHAERDPAYFPGTLIIANRHLLLH